MLTVEAVLEQLALRVESIDDRLGIASLLLCEHSQLAELGSLQKEFLQIWSLVDVDVPTIVLVLLITDRVRVQDRSMAMQDEGRGALSVAFTSLKGPNVYLIISKSASV